MRVHILGAHCIEDEKARLISLLVDNVLAIDAGGLTSSLSLVAQEKIKAVLITHHHFDHVRDLVTLGMNVAFRSQVKVYALKETFDVLIPCLLDGKIYVNFAEFPSKEKPSLEFHIVEPYREETIEGYKVLPLPVRHPVPSVGYLVTSSEGRSFFYTADTGPGLDGCWERISPHLLITDVTGLNLWQERLLQAGHLSAQFLKQELVSFRRLKGYLPSVVVIHTTPQFEKEIKGEVAQIAMELGADISVGYEGMRLNV